LGKEIVPFRKTGFDTGCVKNPKLFEKIAACCWYLAAVGEAPGKGRRSEPYRLFTVSPFFHVKKSVKTKQFI